jgi:hypothetical protein
MVLRYRLVRHLIRGPCGDLMYAVDEQRLAANPMSETGVRLSPNAAIKERGWYRCRRACY